MRTLRLPWLALTLALLGAGVLSPAPAQAQESVEVQVFYRELDNHGRWFSHPQYGYVWSPDVDPDWRPYTRGQWVHTDEHGWYWESEEPFGWAVFHYGRWFLDEQSGWVWVPGTEWAPAWVAWRHSDQQVGWAPLPPEAEWRGETLNFSATYYDSPRYVAAWCFVPVALLTATRVYRHVYAPHRNVVYVRQTRWVASHRYVDRRIYNIGFDRFRYERIVRKPVPSLRIVTVNRPQDYGRRGINRTEINVYRPRIIAAPVTVPPPRLVEPPRRQGPFVGPGGPGDVRRAPGVPDVSRPRVLAPPQGPGTPPSGPAVVRPQPPLTQPPTVRPPQGPTLVQPPQPPQPPVTTRPVLPKQPPPVTSRPVPQPPSNPAVIRPPAGQAPGGPPSNPALVRPPVSQPQQPQPPRVQPGPPSQPRLTPTPGGAPQGPGAGAPQPGSGPKGGGPPRKKQQDQGQPQIR
jgi:hypothetical protein